MTTNGAKEVPARVPDTFQLKGSGASPLSFMLAMIVRQEIHVSTVQSLLASVSTSPNLHVFFQTEADSLVSRSRSVLMELFLRNRSAGDVLLFIDSDIIWKPPSVERIVRACLETESSVCGMYPVRDTANPHAALRLLPGQRVEMSEGAKDLVEIMYPATGFLAIHRRVVERMAEELPVTFSGPREFHPFFLPFIADDGEYLSEDYAFAERARLLGFKAWLDPSIALGHQGLRTYTLADLSFSAGMQAQTLTMKEGGPDKTDVVGDFDGYMKVTRQQAWEILTAVPYRKPLAEEWDARKPGTPEQVSAFYQDTKHYLVECAKFNTMRGYWARVYQATRVTGKVVDFGGGIGSVALDLAAQGAQMTFVELPSAHRTFAEWRFKKRGLDIPVFSSLEEVPGDQDAVVATDVIEHIHPNGLADVMREVARVLKPGGLFVPVNDFIHAADLPQHFDTKDIFGKLCEINGLEERGQVYVKAARVSSEVPAMAT